MKRFVFLGGALMMCVAARADVKVPSVFSDNMIFQRGVQAPVWARRRRAKKSR